MREEKQPAVYIMANGPRGTIYAGVTSALWNRAWKIEMIEKFNPAWVDLHDDIDPSVRYEPPKLDSRLRGNDDSNGGD